MATIRYFVPDDGDTEEHPNVYIAPKNPQPGRPPTLGQIKASFPLPGRYHFRFKAPLIPGADQQSGAAAVWMDCRHDDQPVGVWRNGIVAKVTRISMEDNGGYQYTPPPPATEQAPQIRQQRSTAPHPQRVSPVSTISQPPQPVHQNNHQHHQQQDVNLLGVFDHQPHSHSAPVSSHSSSADLLGNHSGGQAPNSGGESLLDFGHDHHHHQNSTSSGGYGDDLLGMGGHHTGNHHVPHPSQQQNSQFPF